MKRKLYTKNHDIDILKKIDHDGGQFTAEEHAYAIEKEFGNTVFRTKDTLIRDYLTNGGYSKLSSLEFLIKRVIQNRYRNILSLGAGQCVLEHLLKLSLPDGDNVVASDFDAYFIEKAKQFFPEITSVTFDFFKDKIKNMRNKVNLEFDIAVFFGSAYVMDDQQFINIFSELKKTKIKEIIDFHAGYMDLRFFLYFYILTPLVKNNLIRQLFRKPPIIKDDYLGKFHGYARNRSELRNLYKKCGLKIIKETSIGDYKYVAILK